MEQKTASSSGLAERPGLTSNLHRRRFNNRIQVFVKRKTGCNPGTSDKISDLYYPYDIAMTQTGDLYVVEYGAGRVSKYDRSGKLLADTANRGQDPPNS